MFVCTLLLKGGLYQIMFLCRVLLGRVVCLCLLWVRGFVCPLDFRAVSYSVIALLNSSSLQELSDILRLIESGSCLIMLGGWFDFALMYSGWLLGFL